MDNKEQELSKFDVKVVSAFRREELRRSTKLLNIITKAYNLRYKKKTLSSEKRFGRVMGKIIREKFNDKRDI